MWEKNTTMYLEIKRMGQHGTDSIGTFLNKATNFLVP
jgi:hypothetical protein